MSEEAQGEDITTEGSIELCQRGIESVKVCIRRTLC
jgi:hypothetical protein